MIQLPPSISRAPMLRRPISGIIRLSTISPRPILSCIYVQSNPYQNSPASSSKIEGSCISSARSLSSVLKPQRCDNSRALWGRNRPFRASKRSTASYTCHIGHDRSRRTMWARVFAAHFSKGLVGSGVSYPRRCKYAANLCSIRTNWFFIRKLTLSRMIPTYLRYCFLPVVQHHP